MADSVDVQVAVLATQMNNVLEALVEAKACRKVDSTEIQNIVTGINAMSVRLAVVEKQLSTQAPTIEEFITIKHQVKGAGIIGRWAWVAGGFLLAALYQSREAIRSFFNL